MIPDLVVFLLGIFATVSEGVTAYRILKKKYGKESRIIEGKIVAVSVESGLIKTYTPCVEYYVEEIKYKQKAAYID